MDMDAKKKRRIGRALSNRYDKENHDNQDGFYVYMLCDKKSSKPIYIGKGYKERVFSHEKDSDAFKNAIEDDIKKEMKNNAHKLSNDKLNVLISNRLSVANEKLSEIYRLKKEDNLDTVIVKYGLTEHEAFMAESALINMHSYIYKEDSLTNIVNGHMSEREKNNVSHKTKAWSAEDFFKNCTKEPRPISDIQKEYFKDEERCNRTVEDGCGVVFIKINTLYPVCTSFDSDKIEDAILDATKGFWEIEQPLEWIDYVFAMYESKVVGVYCVNRKPDNWMRKRDLGTIDMTANLPKGKDGFELPFVIKDIRENEYEWINVAEELDWQHEKFIKTYPDAKSQIGESLDNWGKRRVFKEDKNLTGKEEEKFERIKKFVGEYIDIPKVQQTIYYNFHPKTTKDYKKGEFR